MAYQLKERDLLHNKSHRKQFIQLAFDLNRDQANWVGQPKMSQEALFDPKHPFFETSHLKAWILVDQQTQRPVGRIAAIVNLAHNQFHQDKVGFFGLFECINDLTAAGLLIKAAEDYLKAEGRTSMLGPMNPSTNYECGLLIQGFDDPPQMMMTYNPPYYAELLGKLNFSKAKDLLAYSMPTTIEMPEVVKRIAERTETSHKITYRPINKSDWVNEVDRLIDIYNDAWEKNWGFVPMSRAEFQHMAKDLKMIADPRFILIAEVGGVPAAFLVCLPDYNQIFRTMRDGRLFPTGIFKLLFHRKRIDRVRVITLGVKKAYRKIGLEALLYIKIQEEVLKAGHYRESEMSWILEDNLNMNKPLQRMGAQAYKTYRLYERAIPQDDGQ